MMIITYNLLVLYGGYTLIILVAIWKYLYHIYFIHIGTDTYVVVFHLIKSDYKLYL